MKVTCLSNNSKVLRTCDNFYVLRDLSTPRTTYTVVSYYTEDLGKKGGYAILARYDCEFEATNALKKLHQFINEGKHEKEIFEFPEEIQWRVIEDE